MLIVGTILSSSAHQTEKACIIELIIYMLYVAGNLTEAYPFWSMFIYHLAVWVVLLFVGVIKLLLVI